MRNSNFDWSLEEGETSILQLRWSSQEAQIAIYHIAVDKEVDKDCMAVVKDHIAGNSR